uniref:Uncharacterized protein n=1 Tax=Romanomermis culicivorax TaxID=13658 RepID=A0A915HHS7_ROMCU
TDAPVNIHCLLYAPYKTPPLFWRIILTTPSCSIIIGYFFGPTLRCLLYASHNAPPPALRFF